MNIISSTSNVIGFVVGIISIMIWLWKLNSWLRAKNLRAKKDAEKSRGLAIQLISQTTNTERRSDIYAYVILQDIEIKTNKIRALLVMAFLGAVVLVEVILFAYLSRVSEIDYLQPRVMFTSLLFILQIASFVMLIFYYAILRRIEDGWSAGVREILDKKLEKHLF